MAKGLNKVMLIGHLGKDPDVRVSNTGSSFGSFSLATTESRKKDDGTWEEYPEWHRVTVFGRTAEIVRDYIKKGAKIYIEGRLQTKKYTGKDGVEKYQTEILCNDLMMLDGKENPSRDERNRNPPAHNAQNNFDDDIPF